MRSTGQLLIAGLALVVVPAAGFVIAEVPRTDPAADRYIRSSPGKTAERFGATMATNRVVPAMAQARTPRWVTVLGNVENAGSYEMGTAGMSLRTLVSRCGGPDDLAQHRVHLVRDGRSWPGTLTAETRLRDGDLVVLQARGPSEPSPRVTLGLIGLSDGPKAVRVPSAKATLEGILALARQTHLQPDDVTVLVDGARAVPVPEDARLPDCAVLVFDPARVKQSAVPPFPTNTFFLDSHEAILLTAQSEPAKEAATAATGGNVPEQRSNAVPAGVARLTSSVAEEASASPPEVPPEQRLSPLPTVENVPPPREAAAMRTADRSGAIPLGRPEAPSHIIRFSPEDFVPPVPNPRVATTSGPRSSGGVLAPAPPEHDVDPVGLPVEVPDSGEAGSQDDGAGNLWPILISAVLLGAGTFYAIRRFRDSSAGPKTRETIDQLKARLGRRATNFENEPELEHPHEDKDPQFPASAVVVEQETDDISAMFAKPTAVTEGRGDQSAGIAATPETGTMLGPDEVLRQLVANRLNFREEAVELPRSLFVQGRSNAPSRRRVDAGGESAGEPHFDHSEDAISGWRPSQTDTQYGDGRRWPGSAPAERAGEPFSETTEQIDNLGASRDLGTPFEQALAKLRQSR